jgi:hypothetical protein
MTCIGVEKQFRALRYLRNSETVLGTGHDIGNSICH